MSDESTTNAEEGSAQQTWAVLASAAIKTATDSPDMKSAGTSLARTTRTIAVTIENALLPLAAVNFGIQKAKAYFQERFRAALAEKAAHIPPDQLREPKPSVAGPALQGLAFSHEEPPLEKMYLNLLATAMDGRRQADDAHPGFVEIVKQLTGTEAQLLEEAFLNKFGLSTVQLRLKRPNEDGSLTIYPHLVPVKDEAGGYIPSRRLDAMLDNWKRLGLIEVRFDRAMADPKEYEWAPTFPTTIIAKQQHETNGAKIEIMQGVVERTEFGRLFAAAVGIGKRAQ